MQKSENPLKILLFWHFRISTSFFSFLRYHQKSKINPEIQSSKNPETHFTAIQLFCDGLGGILHCCYQLHGCINHFHFLERFVYPFGFDIEMQTRIFINFFLSVIIQGCQSPGLKCWLLLTIRQKFLPTFPNFPFPFQFEPRIFLNKIFYPFGFDIRTKTRIVGYLRNKLIDVLILPFKVLSP